MLRGFISSLLIGFISFHVDAQENLIPNGNFEELGWPDAEISCPAANGAVDYTKYWRGVWGSSIDYYNSCSNDSFPNWGVPNNFYGYQEDVDIGNGYIGFGQYTVFWQDKREYVFVQLEEPLMAGQGYYMEFFVNLKDSVNYAFSGLGALFTMGNPNDYQPNDFFNIPQVFPGLEGPQIENPIGNLLDDTQNWMKISGTFVASGGESYVTLGGFRRDAEDNIQQVNDSPETLWNWDLAAYYVDNVLLMEDNSIGMNELLIEVLLSPNPATEYLTINSNHPKLDISILSIAGQVLQAEQLIGSGNHQLDLNGLSAGVYFVRMQTSDGERVEKLVIQ